MKNKICDKEYRTRFQREMGQRLRMSRLMLDRNLTRFADKYGVLTNRWRQWEEGNHPADVCIMGAMCDELGFTLDWLYRGQVESLEPALRARVFEHYPEVYEEWRKRNMRHRVAAGALLPDEPAKGRRRTSRGMRLRESEERAI